MSLYSSKRAPGGSDDPPRLGLRQVLAISSVMASATIYTIVQGLTYPLLSLILASKAVAEWEIGTNAAMMPAGMLVAAVLAPRIVSRFGLFTTCVVSLCGVSVCMLLIGVVDNHWVWMPLRFATGFLLSTIFVTTDTWVNELVDDSNRGKTVGLYSMLLSVGFALGPAILAGTGSTGFTPFLIVIILPLIALVPLLLNRSQLPTSTGLPPQSTLRFFRKAPILLACVAAAAFADQGAMSLLPVYGLLRGFSESEASGLLVVMIVGSIALMFPIGWLADRLMRTRLVIGCVAATILFSLSFPFTNGAPAFFVATTFFWGGLYYGIYTLSLVRLGEQYRGTDLVAGTAACGAMWGIGGMVGTPLIGAAMAPMGPDGFAWTLAAVFVLLLVALLVASRRPLTEQSPQNSDRRTA